MTLAAATPATFPADWRWHHAHAARCLDDVERLFPGRFDLSGLDHQGIDRAAALFGMRVPPYYLDLAQAADERDPIWRLAVPSPLETHIAAEELHDPISDERSDLHPLPALTRRYVDRVLLYPTPTCSVHCRHCFRKRLVDNADYSVSDDDLHAAVEWIASRPEIHEVILTGGDPLTLSDQRLFSLLDRLSRLTHIWSLRLHTRMPVVNPFRVTDELAAGLGAIETPVIVVAHFNHAVEVTAAAALAVRRLLVHGVPTLNQAVLLAGVNDTPASHRDLLWALVRARIRPYALHHADLVPGTAHLRTSVTLGRELLAGLRGSLPGHALPHYMLDLPGGHGKVSIGEGRLEPTRDANDTDAPDAPDALESFEILAPDGSRQRYPPRPPDG